MNEESHWNTIAPSYEDEIFDVFKSDKQGKLQDYFNIYADASHTAIDFGCGVGKAFEYIAPKFKKILATDISGECLEIAKTKGYKNITYKQADLTSPKVTFPKADFAVCVNVAILPEVEKNYTIIKNVKKSLRVEGSAIFVIPSLESVLFSSWRLIDWYKREGKSPSKIPASELAYFNGSKTDIIQGKININGVVTKHYTASEIEVVFQQAGLTVISIEKLEYDWNTEFGKVPSWMKSPYPWDWLVECRRKD